MSDETIKTEIIESLTDENATVEDINISSNGKSIKKTSLRDRIWALEQMEKRVARSSGVKRAKARFKE